MSRTCFDDVQVLGHPKESPHWQNLPQKDAGETYAESLKELCEILSADLQSNAVQSSSHAGLLKVAFWSCLCGYIEALATHKIESQRYSVFPIPISALQRLVEEEFLEFVESMKSLAFGSEPASTTEITPPSHREIVRRCANGIWSKARTKSTQVRDEWHANSVYVCMRSEIDKKSIDCFGAAVVSILASRLIEDTHDSCLTLSEDHAYETHLVDEPMSEVPNVARKRQTCEVAVPGATKRAESKRGQSIDSTFPPKSTTTPETSWLYMASNPVVCDSLGMMLVAVVGNINCAIGESTKAACTTSSAQLFDIKRDLLWTLYDNDCMAKFPFGLFELGDCEEHRSTPRSEVCVNMPMMIEGHDEEEEILVNEKLFLEAIHINKTIYNDAQCYPYFCAGHYHKDAGNKGAEEEYRLAYALMYYAEAVRVASQYRYEVQLNKHMTSVALLITEDILSPKYDEDSKIPRVWQDQTCIEAATSWLYAFFDSICFWEEQTSSKNIVEILSPSHKFSISKLFQMIPQEQREATLTKIFQPASTPFVTIASSTTGETRKLPFFSKPRSLRMGNSSSLLVQALRKPKVKVGEMAIAIPSADAAAPRSHRRRASKRTRCDM